MKILLQSPIRETINEIDSQGFNCLYYAVYHGHLNIVKQLKSVQIEYAVDEKGTTCLHVAIMRGHNRIVEFLLNKTPEYEEEASPTKNPKDKK